MSAAFSEAKGSLRGTLLGAGGFLGFDMMEVDSRLRKRPAFLLNPNDSYRKQSQPTAVTSKCDMPLLAHGVLQGCNVWSDGR